MNQFLTLSFCSQTILFFVKTEIYREVELCYSAIPAVRMTDLETNCEILWVKLLCSPHPLLFSVFYHPPDSSVSTLEGLHSSLSSIPSGTPLVLCGDFNVPFINWSVVSPAVSFPVATQLCSIALDSFLSQLVVHPTRGKNVLDLVFTNCPDSFTNIQIVDNLPGTDYDSLEFSSYISALKSSKCVKELYNYAFLEVLSLQLNFDDDIEAAWTCWKDLFLTQLFVRLGGSSQK